MRVKFKVLLFIPLFLLISSTVFAGDFWPMQVGAWYEFDMHDSATPQNNEWTMRAEVLSTVTYDSQDYFLIGVSNQEYGGSYDAVTLRFTDTEGYFYNGTEDVLMWQQAAVGTTWSHHDGDGEQVTQITSIESVTVPYGTFDNVYVHRKYYDPDAEGEDNSPYWYEYVVPGAGVVKNVDYWQDDADNPPVFQELSAVGVAPEPVSSILFLAGGATLGFRRFRKKRKNIC